MFQQNVDLAVTDFKRSSTNYLRTNEISETVVLVN